MAAADAGQMVMGLPRADDRPLDVAEDLPEAQPLGARPAAPRPPDRPRGRDRRCPTPATGSSSLPKRQERMQSQPMSSAGSPRWASSQSITAASPSASTMKLPSRKSPWTSRRLDRLRGVCAQPAQAELDRWQRLADRDRAGAPTPRSARWPDRRRGPAGRRRARPGSIAWILASASASWPGSRSRASLVLGLAQDPRAPPRCPRRAAISTPARRSDLPSGSKAIGSGTGTPASAAAPMRAKLLADRDQRLRARRVTAEDEGADRPPRPARSHARRRRGSG